MAKVKMLIRKKRRPLIIAAILILILAVFGTNAGLYLNYLLGNNIIVKIVAEDEHLTLKRGEPANFSLEASAKTNPFCKLICNFTFMDISRNSIIGEEEAEMSQLIPVEMEYSVQAPRIMAGQQLYRFTMTCHSIKNSLCHTKEEPVRRDILLTAEYVLSDEEKLLKEYADEEAKQVLETLTRLMREQKSYEKTLDRLNEALIVNELVGLNEQLEQSLKQREAEIMNAQEIWALEKYFLLADAIAEIEESLAYDEKEASSLGSRINGTVESYNRLISALNSTADKLRKAADGAIVSEETADRVSLLVSQFNELIESFSNRTTIEEKEELAVNLTKKAEEIAGEVDAKKESLRQELEQDIAKDALCEAAGICYEHPSIEERSAEAELRLSEACAGTDSVRADYREAREGLQEQYDDENYTSSGEFWGNVSVKAANIRQEIINVYLAELQENSSNGQLIREILTEGSLLGTEEYPQYNLTPALVEELEKLLPEKCRFTNLSVPGKMPDEIKEIRVAEAEPVSPAVQLGEPKPQCCVFGKCEDCCEGEECRDDPSTYPVILLHGHALSKETSAEYSLDSLDKIQHMLEEDGYLNAGAISSYRESTQGIWGKIKVPIAIRASYYFDAFSTEEEYVIVQTKSENIDTYAVRLKDIVDRVKYMTGKPKVNIIAHSMGGLVSRRYIQVFGSEDVEKLIMIGTPNKGIVGNIADYCPLTGEKLECRDMNKGSVFLQKLNSGEKPDIPMVNIVGTGCLMGESMGDGIVLEENVVMEEARNYFFEGSCKTLEPLHQDLKDTEKYPEVYKIIIDELREK
ncbi:alpha/beta fold hydrolase [Candidatus Woesearchaeota archaeon]|nr:alpha/beta fold hydrolase [Candidatus Woesearchaeota archaeon]